MSHEPSLDPKPPASHQQTVATTEQELANISVVSLREMFSTRPHVAQEFLVQYYEKFAQAFPNPTERPLLSRLEAKLCDPKSPLQIIGITVGDQIVGGRHFKAFLDNRIPFAAGEFFMGCRDTSPRKAWDIDRFSY